MIFVLAALCLALIGALVHQQAVFTRMLQRARDEAHAERAELLQRIQDPPTAVAVHAQRAQEDEPVPRYFVNFDDDDDFNNYRTQMEG